MLKILKFLGFILSPFVIVFLYVFISSSGLIGELPEDGEIVYSPRPTTENVLTEKQIFFFWRFACPYNLFARCLSV